jgi:hypothetical protein
MTDLSPIPTATLQRMHAKVRRLMNALIAIDVVAVGAFALLMLSRRGRLVPFLLPVLLLPTIALVPVVGRFGAISLELKTRAREGR